MGFSPEIVIDTRPSASGSDSKLPHLSALDLAGISVPTALSGTTGNDVQLVNGDQWQQLYGSRTTHQDGSWNAVILNNKDWVIGDDLTYYVGGNTIDNRIGTHIQSNNNPRFDHFMHTRTEIHDQPQVVTQPTQEVETVQNKLEFHQEKHAVTGLYMVANGVKLELDDLETTAKGFVVDLKAMRIQNTPTDLTNKPLVAKIGGFLSRVFGSKLDAGAGNVKAVAIDASCGARVAANMPIGA